MCMIVLYFTLLNVAFVAVKVMEHVACIFYFFNDTKQILWKLDRIYNCGTAAF